MVQRVSNGTHGHSMFKYMDRAPSLDAPSQSVNMTRHFSCLGLDDGELPYIDGRNQLEHNLAVDIPSQSSQEFNSLPDFLTPVEQQFQVEYEPYTLPLDDDASKSPAPSPLRIQKRPRHQTLVGSMQLEEDCGSQGSQSQGRSGEASATIKSLAGPRSLLPPVPKPRDVMPPSIRNPYLDRNSEGVSCFQSAQPCLPRRPYQRFTWEYHQQEKLGYGHFSEVWKVQHRISGKHYAVKTNADIIVSLPSRNFWLNEVQVLAAVEGHPNVITMHDAWFEPHSQGPDCDGEKCYIKMELCLESLQSMLKKKVHFKEQDLLKIVEQIASALKHIHSMDIIHMDVKPDNIYQSQNGVFKLGDFGLSTLKDGQRLGNSEGDSKYLAPEVLKRDSFQSTSKDKIDMFALGATIYELATGAELPKNGPVWHDIRQGKLTVLPHISVRFQALLKKLMHPDPGQRPTADALLKSPLLNSISAVPAYGSPTGNYISSQINA